VDITPTATVETPAGTAAGPGPGAARAARWLLGGALLWGVLLRLRLAFTDDGIYWPDEIYQGLEPAHRLVFGYGLVAWEFVQGARSWLFPGFVAALMKLAVLLGLDSPRGYLGLIRTCFVGIAAATAWATYKLGRSNGASPLAAAAGAAAFSLSAPAIYFAHRAMAEVASALPAAIGLWLALERGAARRRILGGSALLGLSAVLRLQNGILCAGLLVALAARRRFREALWALGALAGMAALYGLLDRLTWGGWFHSALVYLQFNLVEGGAARWGTSSAGYYLRCLFTSMPALFAALVVLVPLSARRAGALLAICAAFLALHSLVPHKELRFLFPALPLLFALAGCGLDAAARRIPLGVAAGALVACAALSALTLRSLTFGDLGQYLDARPGAPALDDMGPVNRLLLRAGGAPDLCGLEVEAVHLAWTGGETYLHRPVPLYPHTGPRRDSHRFNYAVTRPAWAGGGEVVATDDALALVRFPWGCVPDPTYDWRLP